MILGDHYKHMILRTFRDSLPNVYKHLNKRSYFCDYMLLTGIFADRQLDEQHRDLYMRILNEYQQRQQLRELFGRHGEPDNET